MLAVTAFPDTPMVFAFLGAFVFAIVGPVALSAGIYGSGGRLILSAAADGRDQAHARLDAPDRAVLARTWRGCGWA
ncbi:MAG: hypothetical protein ABW173_00180 [Sphingomonas sp.]